MAPYFRNFRHQNRDFAIAAALAAALTVGFGAWMVLRVAGVDVSRAVDDVGEAVAALVAAVACSGAAWRCGRSWHAFSNRVPGYRPCGWRKSMPLAM